MLSPASLAQIDREIAKYPADQRQSAVMSALRIAQVEKGWLATETMDYIANYLGMPAIAVAEVATFYNMYDTVPVGKYKVTLCTNISCMLMGAPELVQHVKQRLDCDFGETTADGKFTLKEGECMGACGDAPVCLINNHRMEGFLTPEKIDAILKELN
ncbi:MAG: NADH-quinone oxidoreductase subunit NuoE [Sulfuriferula sp.]